MHVVEAIDETLQGIHRAVELCVAVVHRRHHIYDFLAAQMSVERVEAVEECLHLAGYAVIVDGRAEHQHVGLQHSR